MVQAEIEVINWQKAMQMTKPEIIRFQLMVHCYVEKIPNISPALLDCMTLLGKMGSTGLISFCELLTTTLATIDDEKRQKLLKEGKPLPTIFESMQSSRNALARLEERGLIVKETKKTSEGKNKKHVLLSPILKIQNTGNVLVDIKCFSPNKEILQK